MRRRGCDPQKVDAECLVSRPKGNTFPSKAMLNSKFSNQTHGRFTYGDYNSRRTYCFRVGGPRDLLRFENRILRLIANGAPVQDTAHQLCHEVEAFLPGVICTVMTVDPAGLLDPLAAPS